MKRGRSENGDVRDTRRSIDSRRRPSNAPALIASVTGTDADPQVRSAQLRKLADAGIIVAPSNAAAAALAIQCVR